VAPAGVFIERRPGSDGSDTRIFNQNGHALDLMTKVDDQSPNWAKREAI